MAPGAEPQVSHPSQPRNIIIWLTDDTRADRYRLWNSKSRVETPIIDEFSKHATRFAVAYVQGNESRVSHASLFTGLYPAQLERARSHYREHRDVLLDALDEQFGDLGHFMRPDGGGHIWLTLRQPLDDAQLYREALAAGVTFVPGPAMLVEAPRATHLRLSYGLPDRDDLREGVRRLASTVRSLGAGAPQRRSLPVT